MRSAAIQLMPTVQGACLRRTDVVCARVRALDGDKSVTLPRDCEQRRTGGVPASGL